MGGVGVVVRGLRGAGMGWHAQRGQRQAAAGSGGGGGGVVGGGGSPSTPTTHSAGAVRSSCSWPVGPEPAGGAIGQNSEGLVVRRRS